MSYTNNNSSRHIFALPMDSPLSVTNFTVNINLGYHPCKFSQDLWTEKALRIFSIFSGYQIHNW